MIPYTGGKGILAYDIYPNAIDVKFQDESVYRYTAESVGWVHLNTMKTLARRGKGLNTHINKYIRDGYAKKIGGMQ